AATPAPGDPTITLSLNDSAAGGSYEQEFEIAYSGLTGTGTPVYIYVPLGGIGDPTVDGLNPAFDPPGGDPSFVPCEENLLSDYLITQEQIDYLGNELRDQIVAVDEAHFGPISGGQDDALVTLVYNVPDDSYYDCAETTYTAGYFAPEYLTDYDLNVMVVDAFDWVNRIGDQTGNPIGRSELYEGVIAHELEHLLQNYSDPGELSWVDEGLADFAIFLNGYDVGGSHLTYHQVFHRETSLTRWGGGLENYGASYTWTQYLWEQAGGNGDGSYEPDGEYDAAGGDLLIKMIFEEPADGMVGVQNAIDDFNTATGANLRSATDLFKDWALAIYLDAEGSSLYDIQAVDFGDPAFTRWTIDIANESFFSNRGIYKGAMPEAKWQNFKRVPDQTALPFGTSYEVFKNPGPTFSVSLNGDATTQIAPHSAPDHWYGGFESQKDNILDVTLGGPLASDTAIDFWAWYFIEEGWDYGFVEVTSDGTNWQTIPLLDDAGATVTTDDDPHDNNEEGNGLTGTSGGAYFVDDPSYIHLNGVLPSGTTDVRFRYSTDAAYLDTGWFVDDVQVGGSPVTVSSAPGQWIETTGSQDNHWTLQLTAGCDLTPGEDSAFESTSPSDSGTIYVYRLDGDPDGDVNQAGFSSRCLNGGRNTLTTVISNLPTGDLQYLDASYEFRVTNTSNRK
ncbi:MAG: immune inhibitor A, partial [Chloroflexota bacterium]|nr:immune inhibitor A [Chloroflexota bacterium]